MATTPPPYENITGITRAAMKDNAQETITAYNGVARPGELVVDQLTDSLYVGDPQGNLTLIGPTLLQVSSNSTVTLSQSNQNGQVLQANGANLAVIVPNNATTALPIGYATAVVATTANVLVSPQGTGITTIYVSGSGGSSIVNSTNNVQVAGWTMATLLKVAADTWIISGPGLTTN